MKKVSVITLSLLTFLNSSLVFSASNRSFRRNASNNSIRSSSTTSVSSVDTSITTTDNTDTTSQTLTSVVDIVNTTSDDDDSNKAEVESAIKAVELKISEVKSECLGIKKDFDTLFGLNAVTAVSSFLGAGASGNALIAGVQKAKLDNEIAKEKTLPQMVDELYQVLLLSQSNPENSEEMEEKRQQLLANIKQRQEKLENEISEKVELSKNLGTQRTFLLAGSTATSAVSTGTSIASVINAKKLAEKMSQCNQKLRELSLVKSRLDAEQENTTTSVKAKDILDVCKGYSKDNINAVSGMMTGSAVVSGIGTLASGTGIVTSLLANKDEIRNDDSEAGQEKEKNLNLVSNIMAGITTGTSITSTGLSGVSLVKAQEDSDRAEKCEEILKQY